MKQYHKNLNKLNGILIKNSDMSFQMKQSITLLVKTQMETQQGFGLKKMSEVITTALNSEFKGNWICLIGRNFIANVTHEPGFFLRMATQKYHVIIFKMKVNKECNKQ